MRPLLRGAFSALLVVFGVLVFTGAASAYNYTSNSTNDIYTFTYNETFTINATTTAAQGGQFLIVAGGGGGGGGQNTGGAGGGAGGYMLNTSANFTAGAYTIVVGYGGINGTYASTDGGNGGTSSFAGFSKTGGGGGAKGLSPSRAGVAGGSGGGGAYTGAGGAKTNGEGNNGGAGSSTSSAIGSGGGGGANAVGGAGSGTNGGSGGGGNTTSINGSSVCYAGGGGGSFDTTGAGTAGTATCGGGNGATTSVGGGNGTLGTGAGGGGGANLNAANKIAGKGGSGVVILSLPKAAASTPFSITATDLYDATTIAAFNATVTLNGSSTTYSTTNGTINLNYSINATYPVNVTVFQQHYFSNTTLNYNATPLAVVLKPFIFANATYVSNPIDVSSVLNFTPVWYVTTPVNTSVGFNFTCDAEDPTPSWTGNATNNTVTLCPVAGSQFEYMVTMTTTYNRTTPRVLNLSVSFLLGTFTITAVDGTNGSAITSFNATTNGSTVVTTNGTITIANVTRGSIQNITGRSLYYSDYVNDSYNTSANLVIAFARLVPLNASNVSYLQGYNFTAINWTNPNASIVSGWRVYLDGVRVANLSADAVGYNFTPLATNTSFTFTIEDFTPVGGAANYSFVAATLYDAAPNVTRVFPVDADVAIDENSTTQFTITASSPSSASLFVNWLLNGVAQFWEWITSGGSSTLNFSTNYTSSGLYNVTANVTDLYNVSAAVTWNVTVVDTYPAPAEPYALLPVGGEFEYEIPLFCAIDYQPVRPARFDFVESINGSSYVDMNVSVADGLVVFDTRPYAYGTNFTFGCRITTPSGVSNYTYSSTFTRTNKNHFYLFAIDKNEAYDALVPYTLGYLFEGDNSLNVSLYVGFVDCNGDGVWDYTFNYRDSAVTRARETFACVNARGRFQTVIGMTLFKNNSASWDGIGCSGLSSDETICAVYKTYEVTVQ